MSVFRSLKHFSLLNYQKITKNYPGNDYKFNKNKKTN